MNYKIALCALSITLCSTNTYNHISQLESHVKHFISHPIDSTIYFGKVAIKGAVAGYSGWLCGKYACRAADRYVGRLGHVRHIDLKRIVYQARGPVKRFAIITGLALVAYEVGMSCWNDLHRSSNRNAH